MAKKYTLDDIRSMTTPTITPVMAADVIGGDPHALRLMARMHPEQFGFSVMCIGNRVKIPRLPFLNAIDSKGTILKDCSKSHCEKK